MRPKIFIGLLLAFFCAAPSVFAGVFRADKLAEMDAAIETAIASNQCPGGVLWLEITGLFFALFALFFVQSVYRVHTAWRQGPERTHLLLYCAMALAFAWFSVSSFARAYRKSKRGPRLGRRS